MKVNVWQVGYKTYKGYVMQDKKQLECRAMGYVEIEMQDLWEEEVWNLLNWSCWNYDKKGHAVKPENVHSPLDHCNSDVILQIEGTQKYMYAKFAGFGYRSTLASAVNAIKDGTHNLWAFKDVRFSSGYVKRYGDKAYISKDGKTDWVEITW